MADSPALGGDFCLSLFFNEIGQGAKHGSAGCGIFGLLGQFTAGVAQSFHAA